MTATAQRAEAARRSLARVRGRLPLLARSSPLSQVVLSFGIPFALVPLVLLTGRRDRMGTLASCPGPSRRPRSSRRWTSCCSG